MDTFYITADQFWDWFDRAEDEDNYQSTEQNTYRKNNSRQMRNVSKQPVDDFRGCPGPKRLKSDFKPKTINETEAANGSGKRYIIMYTRHKPGRKNKVWEGDGFLTMLGQIAHLSTINGRLLEEPTLLDEVDYKCVEDMGELLIGNTDVQVVDLDN